MIQGQIELMSPVGSFESLQAAIDAGADAVYFGVGPMNMRARSSKNFTIQDLKEIQERCNTRGVKTYITLNTVIYDNELPSIRKICEKAKDAGVSAIIASDQGVINYGRSIGLPVHISTQLNISNFETVKFYSHFADVMVLSRELSIEQISEICRAIKENQVKGPSGELVKVEVFAHGALCMAVSGKCYLSLGTQNASANRGECMQNCRRKYRVLDIEDGHELEIDNEFIMSAKDLCTIDFLDRLLDAGISVLKIEGRGRSPEYVSTVTRCYREAIDSWKEGTYTKEKVSKWIVELEKVYNRGFWGGYYLGKELGEWTDKSGSKATQKKVYLGKGIHYFTKAGIAHFKIETQNLSLGDRIIITGPTTGVIESTVDEMLVNDAIVKTAGKDDEVTFPLRQKIRPSGKVYKIVRS